MKDLIFAIASNDKINYNKEHFGDSDNYSLYKINENEIVFVMDHKNTSEEENPNIHADPEKAKGVARMLKKNGVQVVVSKVFGPNIKRIRKKFVCIFIKNMTVDESLKILQSRFIEILEEYNNGETRDILKFN